MYVLITVIPGDDHQRGRCLQGLYCYNPDLVQSCLKQQRRDLNQCQTRYKTSGGKTYFEWKYEDDFPVDLTPEVLANHSGFSTV